jgi:hypothetical protein
MDVGLVKRIYFVTHACRNINRSTIIQLFSRKRFISYETRKVKSAVLASYFDSALN